MKFAKQVTGIISFNNCR